MPLPLLAAGKAAATLAPYLFGAFSRKGKPIDYAEIARWFNSLDTTGALSAGDLAAGEATRSRLTRGASSTAKHQRGEALIRAGARGIAGAPGLETTLARINEGEARGRQAAGDAAEEQLYNVRLGNQRFKQNAALTMLSSRLQSAARDKAQTDAGRTTLINSLLEYTPAAMEYLGGAQGGKVGGEHRFDPATGKITRVAPYRGGMFFGDPTPEAF